MEETTRINLVVAADVPDKLTELAGGERKRGEFLTSLVRAVYAGEREATAGTDIEHLRLTVTGLAAKSMALESRLLTVERHLAAMIADRQ